MDLCHGISHGSPWIHLWMPIPMKPTWIVQKMSHGSPFGFPMDSPWMHMAFPMVELWCVICLDAIWTYYGYPRSVILMSNGIPTGVLWMGIHWNSMDTHCHSMGGGMGIHWNPWGINGTPWGFHGQNMDIQLEFLRESMEIP